MLYDNDMSGGMLYAPRFMDIDTGVQAILRSFSEVRGAGMLVRLMGGFYDI
jgi:hypothetical protein